MRGSNLLWGLLLVVLGALLLLQELEYISIRWRELWQFWPLILIAWGIVILPIRSWLKAGLALMIFAVVLILLLNNFDFRYVSTTKSSNAIALHQYSEPMEGAVEQVKLTMNLFAGDFAIKDSTDELIDVTTSGRKSSFDLMESEMAGIKNLTLNMNETGRNWGRNRSEVSAKISLNPYPQWNLTLDAGSADIDISLERFKVEELSLKLNSSNGTIKLGRGNTRGNMMLNSCNLKLWISGDSGCEITWKGADSHPDFDGFEETAENIFRTENWELATDKVWLSITANSSSITINSY